MQRFFWIIICKGDVCSYFYPDEVGVFQLSQHLSKY